MSAEAPSLPQAGTPCPACEHGKRIDGRPFAIWCDAGEGMMGDVYAAGFLVRYGCVKNPARPAAP